MVGSPHLGDTKIETGHGQQLKAHYQIVSWPSVWATTFNLLSQRKCNYLKKKVWVIVDNCHTLVLILGPIDPIPVPKPQKKIGLTIKFYGYGHPHKLRSGSSRSLVVFTQAIGGSRNLNTHQKNFNISLIGLSYRKCYVKE